METFSFAMYISTRVILLTLYGLLILVACKVVFAFGLMTFGDVSIVKASTASLPMSKIQYFYVFLMFMVWFHLFYNSAIKWSNAIDENKGRVVIHQHSMSIRIHIAMTFVALYWGYLWRFTSVDFAYDLSFYYLMVSMVAIFFVMMFFFTLFDPFERSK